MTNDAYIPDKFSPISFDNACVMELRAPKFYVISELTGSAKYMGQIK